MSNDQTDPVDGHVFGGENVPKEEMPLHVMQAIHGLSATKATDIPAFEMSPEIDKWAGAMSKNP